MQVVTSVLRIFAFCDTPVTDKVKVVTDVLRIVIHSLHLCGDLSYNHYELALNRYGFSGFSILPEIT